MSGAARGRVTLVGAGPGDPDLLTIAAVKAIAAADVLLVDDLVDRRVLAHASTTARIVEVGKRGRFCRTGAASRSSSTPQDFIERLMVAEATRGAHVVRLKGGDPYVFGRGGEECATLREAGIQVSVVPGITSGIAAPAALGIPVTHRAWSQGAIFVTGHRAAASSGDGDGPAADVDWAALAATGLTLVVYMGVARCATIVAALIDGGMGSATPAAAIQSAHTPEQREVVATLATLVAAMDDAGIGSPAIVVIGDVVRCATAVATATALKRADADRRAS